MLRSIEDLRRQDYWHEWDQMQCPTLVVGGANSSLLSRDMLCALSGRIPHGRGQQIPNAGHDLHLQRPAAWRRVAVEFLQTL